VKRYLLPVLPASTIADQFAFRPTGSTTAALVDLTHHVTKMFETNRYFRCLLIDFSKAFDTVDHVIILKNCLLFHFLGILSTGLFRFLLAVISLLKTVPFYPILNQLIEVLFRALVLVLLYTLSTRVTLFLYRPIILLYLNMQMIPTCLYLKIQILLSHKNLIVLKSGS
jgi:hypothetical protein